MSAEGSYNVTINSPMGKQEGVLTLVVDGDSLSGKIASSQGEQEFEGGTIDGTTLRWSVNMTRPMPMQLDFDAVVDGDNISGNVKLGMMGNASFEGTRA